MSHEFVEFPSNGGIAQGYLATPGTGAGPGVVVIQEYWGLVPHIQDVCDRLAGEGFVALAPDLFHGEKTEEPDEADKLMMAMAIDQAAKDMRGAAGYLKSLPQVTSEVVGIVGFCMGGALALYAASISAEIGPVVDFYGGHPEVKPDFSKMRGPVLGTFAAQDDWIDEAAVRDLDAKLTAAGIPHDFKTYPGTDHAFFNDARKDQPNTPYNAPAAQDAWVRMLRFFRQHVR